MSIQSAFQNEMPHFNPTPMACAVGTNILPFPIHYNASNNQISNHHKGITYPPPSQ